MSRRDQDRRLVALLPRTSDIDDETMTGTEALGEQLGARMIGKAGRGERAEFRTDLQTAHGVLLEAGGQLDDAYEEGETPLLLAGSCSVCLATLPVVVRHCPDAWIVWLDAHADFNTPDTTPSQFLGGMGLAAACGLWDAGFEGTVDPTRVVMFGIRDLDAQERVLVETKGVTIAQRPADLADALDGREVFVHLDLDIVDPTVLPQTFAVDGGLDFDQLRRLLDLVAGASDLVGAEVTSAHPDFAGEIAGALAPLL